MRYKRYLILAYYEVLERPYYRSLLLLPLLPRN
jgi:hypothetical protein